LASNVRAVSKPSPSAKSKTSPAASSPNTGQTSPVIETCASLPASTLAPLMSSREDSRVKTSAPPGRRPGWAESALAFGEKSPGSLVNFDLPSRSWKTAQRCLIEEWATFSETWPRSGMMRSGTAYRLPPLALPISEIGCGLWPTPTKVDGEHPGRVKWKPHQQLALSQAANLTRQEAGLPSGQIDPSFRELLMGYPMSWTEVPPSETP